MVLLQCHFSTICYLLHYRFLEYPGLLFHGYVQQYLFHIESINVLLIELMTVFRAISLVHRMITYVALQETSIRFNLLL